MILTEQELLDGKTNDDRRGKDRCAYSHIQNVAQYDGKTLPQRNGFRQVRFYDLSSTGFSYLTQGPTVTDHVVVALGKSKTKFFVAKIVHYTVRSAAMREFIVGCQFVRRVAEEEFGEPLEIAN